MNGTLDNRQEKQNRLEKTPLKTILLTFLVIGILFLCVDFVIGQVFLPRTNAVPSPYCHHEFKKNFRGKITWGNRQYVFTTNSLGFKDYKKRDVAPTSSTYRILFIGDSFTEGVGYPFELTFVGVFGRLIGEEKYEVLNAASVSSGPKLQYLKLKHIIEDIGLRVNELFVFIDTSDIYDEIVYDYFTPQPKSPWNLARSLNAFLCQNFYFINKAQAIRDIIRRTLIGRTNILSGEYESSLMRHSADPKTALNWSDKNVYNTWGREGLLLADRHVDLIYKLCKKHNIKMNIAVYPDIFQIARKELSPLHLVHWQDFARARGIGLLNYYPYFINETDPKKVILEKFIPGDVHWNKEGHAFMADVLYRYWKKEHPSD